MMPPRTMADVLREAFPGRQVASPPNDPGRATCYLAEGVAVTLDVTERCIYPQPPNSGRPWFQQNFRAWVACNGWSAAYESFQGPTPEWALARAVVYIRKTAEQNRQKHFERLSVLDALIAALPKTGEP